MAGDDGCGPGAPVVWTCGRGTRGEAGAGMIRLTYIAPDREQCGVADYSNYLLDELRNLVDVRHHADPAAFTAAMNADVDLIHIQHQYFVFGGVAPWKNWFARFARQITAPAVM